MARECRRIGINMVLGPVLDITTEGTYIGRRSFGPDPDRVSVLSISYARGLESGNVMSVAK
ncbi:glycosyl hydrolase family 3, partial [Klebsiella oxytoca]